MAIRLCLWMSWHLYCPAGAHGIRCFCSRVAQGADAACVNPVESPLATTAAALRTKDMSELTWASVSTILIDDHIALKVRSGGGAALSEYDGRHGRRNRKNSRKHGNKASAADSSSDDDEAEIATRALAALRKMESRRGTTVCEFCDKPGHELGNCLFNPNNPANKLPAKMLERFFVAQSETPFAGKDERTRTKSSMDKLARTVVRTTEENVGVTSTV
jgi:hypothetical protein